MTSKPSDLAVKLAEALWLSQVISAAPSLESIALILDRAGLAELLAEKERLENEADDAMSTCEDLQQRLDVAERERDEAREALDVMRRAAGAMAAEVLKNG